MTRYMTPRELLDGGFIAEANRRFFHPLGLALSAEVGMLVVVDARAEDPEGFNFGDSCLEHVSSKAALVKEVEDARFPTRLATLGYIIQPVIPVNESLAPTDNP